MFLSRGPPPQTFLSRIPFSRMMAYILQDTSDLMDIVFFLLALDDTMPLLIVGGAILKSNRVRLIVCPAGTCIVQGHEGEPTPETAVTELAR